MTDEPTTDPAAELRDALRLIWMLVHQAGGAVTITPSTLAAFPKDAEMSRTDLVGGAIHFATRV